MLLTGARNTRIVLIMLGEPRRDRAAERREATRRDIIDAAWASARELGLAQVTVRDVAERVGMRAPSLYGHLASKHAIYDAMFAQAWSECLEVFVRGDAACPPDRRGAVRHYARTYFDFATADVVRNQLMNQRTIPGFEPSPDAYAPAVAAIEALRERMARHGITAQEDLDLYVALVGGLADSQLANDPGGDRWSRLLDRAVDMYLRDIGHETNGEPTPQPRREDAR
jgi:AcrR family transcriptional regulator